MYSLILLSFLIMALVLMILGFSRKDKVLKIIGVICLVLFIVGIIFLGISLENM